MLVVIVVLAFFTAYTLMLGLLMGRDPDQARISRRLRELVRVPRLSLERPNAGVEGEEDRRPLKEVLLGTLDSHLTRQGYARRLEARLRKADWRLHVSEFVAFQGAGAGVGLMFSLTVVGGSLWWLFTGLGFCLPFWLLSRRERERVKAFEGQLPDALTMVANSLKSGYSFLQAMDVVAQEMPDPIAREFSQVLRENRVGIPIEDALSRLLDRLPSADLDMAVTAVLVQRQVGGNLAEVLEKIEGTVRERVRLMGEIRTLSAQGRLSGWILSLMPVVLGLVLYLINRDYMGNLLGHPIGWVLLGVAGAMQVTGVLVIRRLVRVDL